MTISFYCDNFFQNTPSNSNLTFLPFFHYLHPKIQSKTKFSLYFFSSDAKPYSEGLSPLNFSYHKLRAQSRTYPSLKLGVRPKTGDLRLEALNSRPSTRGLQMEALGWWPSVGEQKLEALGRRPSAEGPRLEALGWRPSAVGLRSKP